MPIPIGLRKLKHRVFGLLPGRIGLRNRACLHHLIKPSAFAEFDAALAAVGPGDLCIDCGANVGDFTMRFAQTGAQVIAFEPDPWTFQQLRQRVGHLPNVALHNKAVGVRDGVISFFRDAAFDQDTGLHSLASSVFERTDRPQERVEVPVVDFPHLLARLDVPVAMLKIDIEGAEVELLEALLASPHLGKLRDVFVETHELQFPDLLVRTWALRDATARVPGVRFNLDWH